MPEGISHICNIADKHLQQSHRNGHFGCNYHFSVRRRKHSITEQLNLSGSITNPVTTANAYFRLCFQKPLYPQLPHFDLSSDRAFMLYILILLYPLPDTVSQHNINSPLVRSVRFRTKYIFHRMLAEVSTVFRIQCQLTSHTAEFILTELYPPACKLHNREITSALL